VEPHVLVVIPAYNRERYLCAAIESVLRQAYRAWRLVVVDDGSTDGTASVAQRYAHEDDRITVVRQANAGISAARNRGLAEGPEDAPYLAFLDSDDAWNGEVLAPFVETLERAPGLVGAHGLARAIDGEGAPVPGDTLAEQMRARRGYEGRQLVAWPLDAPTTFCVLAHDHCMVTPGACLYRRAAFEEAGGFDPALPVAEDWDLHWRMTRRGDFAFRDEIVLDWRRHDANTSSNARFFQCHVAVRRKMLADRHCTREQRAIAARAFRRLILLSAFDVPLLAARGRLGEAAGRARRAAYGLAQYAQGCLGR